MWVEFADVGGVRTRLYRAGEGPPVLLLHGVGASADIWLKTIGPLAAAHSVYAPDLLDNGFTDVGSYRGGPPQPFILDHLEALLDCYGIGDFVAVGSSFGGLIAALLYFRRPDRLRRLVLVSSGTCFNSEEELARTLRDSYANGLLAIAEPSLESCRRRMSNVVYDPAVLPDALLLMQLTIYGLPTTRAAYERRMKGLMDVAGWRSYRIADRLEALCVPMLLVWGRDDPRVVFERVEHAIKRLPDARLEVFDRCKHFPQLEHPDRFNRLVLEYISAGHDTRSAAD